MVQIGYKLMSEEHGPKALVANAIKAEEAGFDFVSISDHFHPWVDAQGHASFAWSVLGAIAQATTRIAITTGLTCPIIRYHPAIIAQAAATIGLLSDNRFTLAVGAGECLNEHITGEKWPAIPERHKMLEEAIDIFQLLWQGKVCNYMGSYFTINHAQLYDLPARPIPIVVGVSGPASVQLAAEKANGIMATEPLPSLIDGFKTRSKTGGPCYTEVPLAYASSQEAALKIAQERFGFSALGWSVNAELPSPASFEAATKFVRPEDLAEIISAGPDIDRHIAGIQKYVDAGFDHIALVGIGPDQDSFIDFFKTKLGPRLRSILPQ